MASRIFSRASASVRPWETQPGIAGHSATSMPVSSGSSVKASYLDLIGVAALTAPPRSCGNGELQRVGGGRHLSVLDFFRDHAQRKGLGLQRRFLWSRTVH